jgi:hypothetical protein
MEYILQRIDSKPILNNFLHDFSETVKIIVFGDSIDPPNYLNYIAQIVRPDFPANKKVAFVGYISNSTIFYDSSSDNINEIPSIVTVSSIGIVENSFSGKLEYEDVYDWIILNSGEPLDRKKYENHQQDKSNKASQNREKIEL